MTEGQRQPEQPTQRWTDDILMRRNKDTKGAVMMAKDTDNKIRFVASLVDHGTKKKKSAHQANGQCLSFQGGPIESSQTDDCKIHLEQFQLINEIAQF